MSLPWGKQSIYEASNLRPYYIPEPGFQAAFLGSSVKMASLMFISVGVLSQASSCFITQAGLELSLPGLNCQLCTTTPGM